jgi:Xaa-Pro aminopeptidase
MPASRHAPPAGGPAARRAALAAGLRERRLDAFLVTALPNVRYLTGFTGSNGMVLVREGEAVLFTDPRYAVQAAAQADCRVVVSRGPLLPQVVSAIARRRVRRLGFERARISFDVYDLLRAQLPLRTSLEPQAGVVERLRLVKSPEEIALVRQSVLTCSRAFEEAVREARPDMRETGLAAEIEYRMRRQGAEKPAFDTIVAAGARSALPHASPTSAALRTGRLVLVDMGAFQRGYASDMTRMLFFGAPGARVKRLYRAVLEAQLAALAEVRAGVAAGAVDRAARRVLRAEGFERAFVHSTGHGLGLEIHEAPRLGKGEKTVLEAGMTVTVEPGAYLEGFGGVRVEDTVVVTPGGCEILTPTGKELRIL